MTLPEKSYSRDELLRDLVAIAQHQRSAERGGSEDYPQILEDDHVDADELLLRFIADDAITGAFEAIEKWYA